MKNKVIAVVFVLSVVAVVFFMSQLSNQQEATTSPENHEDGQVTNVADTVNVTVGVGNVARTTEVTIGKYPNANSSPSVADDPKAMYDIASTNIDNLQKLISTYYDMTYQYPEQLAGALEVVVPLCAANQRITNRYCPDPATISFIDVYTGKPYPYVSRNRQYLLQYIIHFPDSNTALDAPYFVEGINTLQSNKMAVESIAGRTDSDQDGLNNELENFFGTNIGKPDTDSDGYFDGDEVRGGFDPTGPGKLSLPKEFDISNWPPSDVQ